MTAKGRPVSSTNDDDDDVTINPNHVEIELNTPQSSPMPLSVNYDAKQYSTSLQTIIGFHYGNLVFI